MELVHQLPRGSHYWAAVADDDALAAAVIDTLPPAGPPPLRGWDDTQEKLATLIDQLSILISAQSGLDPESTPRPETAVDRVKKHRMDTKRDRALTQLLGDRY